MKYKAQYSAVLLIILAVPEPSPALADSVESASSLTADQLVTACVSDAAQCDGIWHGVTIELRPTESTITVKNTNNATWDIQCETDSMSDEKSCSLKSRSWVGIRIWRSNRRGQRLSIVSGSKYPGTQSSVRIDNGPVRSIPWDSSFGPAATNALIGEMLRATRIRSRFYSWPLNNAVDGETDLYKFGDVAELFRAVSSSYFRSLTIPSPRPARRRLAALLFADAYPFAAQRLGQQGAVGITVTFGADGIANKCEVTSSSGYAELDNGTCVAIMRRLQSVKFRSDAGVESDTINWTLAGAR